MVNNEEVLKIRLSGVKDVIDVSFRKGLSHAERKRFENKGK